MQVSCSVVCERWLAASAAVESWFSPVFVAMAAGGRGSPRCRQLVGRRSRTGPCTLGQLGVGWCACGLFMVTSRPLWWFCWCAVVLVASWLVCLALVPCRRSGRSRSRICCVQAFRLLRFWLVPGAWGRHGTFLLCAVRPPRGRKAMTSGRTAVKNFFLPLSVPCSLPRPSSVACTTHNPVFRGAP